MGFFKKDTPQPRVDVVEDKVLTTDGSKPRAKQADPGGGVTRYKILGILIDGEFVKPGRWEMQVQGHPGIYRLGDEIELTKLEYQVISKRNVLVPVEALA